MNRRSALVMGPYQYSGLKNSKNLESHAYEAHRRRLDTIRPAIDNRPPKTIRTGTDAKRKKIVQERQHIIDRNNQNLLKKLSSIFNRKPVIPATPRARRNPFEEMRDKKAKRITQENLLLFKAIQQTSSKSTYDRKKMLADRQNNETYVLRLSHYPPVEKRSKSAPISKAKVATVKANP